MEAPVISALEAAGLVPVVMPTPFGASTTSVNAWIVLDDPFTLLDAGCNSADDQLALERALRAHGRVLEDLERVVVTHQHVDHTGLLAVIAERAGAEVVALEVLADWLSDHVGNGFADDRHVIDVLTAHGVPRELRLVIAGSLALERAIGSGGPVDRVLAPGDRLAFAEREWGALYRPGHSPTDTVFHDERRGHLFTGDHMLRDIAPNPYVSRPLGEGPYRPLVAYLDSLEQTRQLDVQLVLPGHGPAFENVDEVIERRFAWSRRAAEDHLRLLGPEPRSAFDVTRERWGDRAYGHTCLTLSQTLGTLELLEHEGRAVRTERDGLVAFHRA